VQPEPLRELDEWLDRYRALWETRLDKIGEALDERHPRIKTDNRSSK
jgi:hypothetical protein